MVWLPINVLLPVVAKLPVSMLPPPPNDDVATCVFCPNPLPNIPLESVENENPPPDLKLILFVSK